MSLLSLILVLVIIGVVLYIIPMDAKIRQAIIALVLVLVVVWLVALFFGVRLPLTL